MAGLQITMYTGSWKALTDSEEAGMLCTASNSEQLSVSLFAAYSLEHLDARLLHHTLSSQTALQCISLLPLSCSPLTSSPLPSFPSLPPPLPSPLPSPLLNPSTHWVHYTQQRAEFQPLQGRGGVEGVEASDVGRLRCSHDLLEGSIMWVLPFSFIYNLHSRGVGQNALNQEVRVVDALGHFWCVTWTLSWLSCTHSGCLHIAVIAHTHTHTLAHTHTHTHTHLHTQICTHQTHKLYCRFQPVSSWYRRTLYCSYIQ